MEIDSGIEASPGHPEIGIRHLNDTGFNQQVGPI